MNASVHSPRWWEPLLKYVAPWILDALGEWLGHPAYGKAAAFFLLLGGILLAPHRVKAVEVVLSAFFLLEWLGQITPWFPWLQACKGYLAPALLAVMAFGSLAIGLPFTISFAKEIVPPEKWQDAHFFIINRLLTALWGFAFLACTVLKFIAGWPSGAMSALCLFIMFSAGCFTRWFPEWYERKFIPEEQREA